MVTIEGARPIVQRTLTTKPPVDHPPAGQPTVQEKGYRHETVTDSGFGFNCPEGPSQLRRSTAGEAGLVADHFPHPILSKVSTAFDQPDGPAPARGDSVPAGFSYHSLQRTLATQLRRHHDRPVLPAHLHVEGARAGVPLPVRRADHPL